MLISWAKWSGFAALLAVALAGSLHFALYYPPPSYLPTNGEKQEDAKTPTESAPNEPRGTLESPIVVQVLPPVPGTQEASERQREQDQKSATDRGLLWFTAVLSAATLALMFATTGLVFLAKQQGIDTRIIQRAYVYVKAPIAQLRFDHTGNLIALRVWVIWKNSGTTPASPMFSMIGATWTPAIDQFQFGAEDSNSVRQPVVLGPDAEINSGIIDISAAHAIAAANGGGHQFIWGWAKYRDAFPDTLEHVIEFCFKVEIQGQMIPAPGACLINFNAHGENNRYYDEN